jgi:hypothetical protein
LGYAGRSTESGQRVETEKKTIWQVLDIDVKCALQMLDASDKHAIKSPRPLPIAGLNPTYLISRSYTRLSHTQAPCYVSCHCYVLVPSWRMSAQRLGQARWHVDSCTCQMQPSACTDLIPRATAHQLHLPTTATTHVQRTLHAYTSCLRFPLPAICTSFASLARQPLCHGL